MYVLLIVQESNFPFNEIVNGTVAPKPTPSPTPAAKPSTSGKATGTYEVTASDLSVRIWSWY